MSGIYISWPFCAQKCTFCNFASGVQPKGLENRYLEALGAEMSRHEWCWTPETVYLGGGTPGSIDPSSLACLLGGIRGRPWREATMEAAPGWITDAGVRGWMAAGINRASLGVQSFVKTELVRTGRKHDAEIVIRDIALLRSLGIENLNVDLIAGLPGQTPSGWRHSLECVARLNVPHVSVYMLEVDDESRLGAEIRLGGKRYGAPDVPSDDQVAASYEEAVDFLADEGIGRYEISNFARPGFESLHNMKYWKQEAYVGFGADAHSFDGATRWQNIEAATDYVERSERGEAVRTETSIAKIGEEKFFVGLRLSQGVVAETADWEKYGATLERFLNTGMMELCEDRVRLTNRGVMVSNEIFEEFLTA